MTPRQLYLSRGFQESSINDEININELEYGIDWGGPISEPGYEQVVVNNRLNILNSTQLQILQERISHLDNDNNYGINTYLEVHHLVEQIL
jgi:hypothetical protein